MSEIRLTDLPLDRHMIECMLVHIVRVPAVFNVANAELAVAHFDSTETLYKTVWGVTKQHYATYHELPGAESLAVSVLAHLSSNPHLPEQVQQEAQELVDWMWSAYATPEAYQVAFAMDLLKRFLRERVVNVQLRQVASATQTGGSDRVAFLEQMTSVIRNAQRIDSLGQSSFTSMVPEQFSRPDRQKIPTTLEVFDRFLDGGNFRGEVNAFLAPSGVGKTMTAIDIICGRAEENYRAELLRPGSGQLCFYISFEEGQELIRPRFWCRAAQINKTRAEAATNYEYLSTTGQLEDYERQLFGNTVDASLEIPGEYNRLIAAKRWMDLFLRVGDFSGGRGEDGRGQVRGHGGIPEIVSYIESEVQAANGRGVDTVVIDWAGSCVRRFLRNTKGGDVKSMLSVELMDFIDQVHSQITARFDCVGWVMHQLKGEVNNKPPNYKFHHADAEWCSSFAVNAWFAFVLGTKDQPTSTAILRCTKARRAEAKPEVVTRINGLYGRLEPSNMVVDTVTGRIATRSETARFETVSHHVGRTPIGDME